MMASANTNTLKLYDTFESWEDCEEAVQRHIEATFQPLIKSSSKRIDNVNKRSKKQYPLDKIHYYKAWRCSHRGIFKPKGRGIRNTKSHKGGCTARILASLDTADSDRIIVKIMDERHNHEVGEDIYKLYARNRILGKEEKEEIEKLCSIDMSNVDLREEMERLSGKTVTLQDAQNVKKALKRKELDRNPDLKDAIHRKVQQRRKRALGLNAHRESPLKMTRLSSLTTGSVTPPTASPTKRLYLVCSQPQAANVDPLLKLKTSCKLEPLESWVSSSTVETSSSTADTTSSQSQPVSQPSYSYVTSGMRSLLTPQRPVSMNQSVSLSPSESHQSSLKSGGTPLLNETASESVTNVQISTSEISSFLSFFKERELESMELKKRKVEMQAQELELRRQELELRKQEYLERERDFEIQRHRFEAERDEKNALLELLKCQLQQNSIVKHLTGEDGDNLQYTIEVKHDI